MRCGTTPAVTDHEAAFTWVGSMRSPNSTREGWKDGELIAWHDSPHVLYLMLEIKPGVRYMHVNTAQGISTEAHARVQGELAATAGVARFAVSDLEFPTLGMTPEVRLRILGPPTSDRDLLPVGLDDNARRLFPFNQRAVFRSRDGLGRYVVHELTPPLGDTPPRN